MAGAPFELKAMVMGREQANDQRYLEGQIGGVRVYGRTLNSYEISRLYADEAGDPPWN